MSISDKTPPPDNPDSRRLTILITNSSDGIVVKRGIVVKIPNTNPYAGQSEFSYKMDWLDGEWKKVEDIIDDQQIAAPGSQHSCGSVLLSLPAASNISRLTAPILFSADDLRPLLENQVPPGAPIPLPLSPSPPQQTKARTKVDADANSRFNDVSVGRKNTLHSSVHKPKAVEFEEEESEARMR